MLDAVYQKQTAQAKPATTYHAQGFSCISTRTILFLPANFVLNSPTGKWISFSSVNIGANYTWNLLLFISKHADNFGAQRWENTTNTTELLRISVGE